MKAQGVALFVFALAAVAHCQLVQIGTPDAHHCERLKVKPNLILEQDADIAGRLNDGSGAPFRDSPIELRLFISPTKQTNTKSVLTDADGHFRIDGVKAGKYRLIASPTRVFQQPESLHCVSKQCELSIALHSSPTDMPDYQCPVR
jgi:hypothetical protein